MNEVFAVNDEVEVLNPLFLGLKGRIVAFASLDNEELAVLEVGDRFPRWFPPRELKHIT
jgi:hypothetical protein